jgi:hypothetical protein
MAPPRAPTARACSIARTILMLVTERRAISRHTVVILGARLTGAVALLAGER